MEDIIYEQDYTKYKKTEQDRRAQAIFDQAVKGGFFHTYSEAMDRIPKVIVERDKENYEYLLGRCDEVAKRRHGRIRGIVDYHKWESRIEVFLPFLEFDSPEEMKLMCEVAEKANMVIVEPAGREVHLLIMINYFDELMTEEHREYLEADAIMQDETLAAMLGVEDGLSPEMEVFTERMNAVLDRFESETEYDRTTVFKAVLEKVSREDEDGQTIERMVALAEALLEKVLHEKTGMDG